MRILEININSFGKFTNYTLKFENNLTIINEDNSFGKTTIAHFIKAMFFGMKAPKGKGKRLNLPRFKYLPWGKTTYGGSLTFIYKGRTYTVTRTFGESLTNDSIVVKDHARNVNIDELNDTKITRDNFGDIIFGVNSDSFEKLNFIQQLEVLYSTDDKIHDDINLKLRGLFGHTAEDSDYASANNILDDFIKELSPSLQRKNSIYNKTDRELNAINSLVFEAEKAQQLIKENTNELDALRKQKSENDKVKAKLDADLKLITNKKLLEKDLNDYNELLAEETNLNLQIKQNKTIFGDNDIADINLTYLEALSNDLSAKENDFNKFKDKTQAEINTLNVSLSKAESTDVESLVIKRSHKEISEKITKLNADVDLLTSKIKKFTVIDILLSIITLAIYFFVVNSKNNKLKQEIANLNKEISELQQRLQNYEQELVTMAHEDNGTNLKLKIAELTENIKQNQLTFETLKLQVFNVYQKYAVTINSVSDVHVAYFKLKNHYERHLELTKKLNDTKAKLQNYDIERINKDLKVFATLDEEKITDNKNDVDAKNAQLIRTITTLEQQIDANENLASNLENYKLDRDELRETMHNYDMNRTLLEVAQKLLKHANQQLAARYLTPLENNVNDLIKKLKLDGYAVAFDGNSEIKLKDENSTEYYDFAYYSAGSQDTISFLVRIALINLVYQDLKPFMILDDTFVNFDDKKIKLVRPLLEKLAENNQIIYFTCSSSRALT
ncbi:MAG: chromosome segregation protein [Tenericutes bacterium ADurb.Bin087]|nr:MAG: chromosome segregation protein [Tenericutes bacterium ADurb.Bin087]